ncbi:MAG: D-alanyl-D-alanine dipeptidase [Alphaproteobacteria bacterium]|jgi:D-alanyl-D-alanine dipeptidase
MTLVEISPPAFDVETHMVYATAENFTGAAIYQRAECYLHADAAALLARSIELAGELGLRLKIFDAYRPAEAQWLLWAHNPDPEFLADPRRGSPHSRGVALDVSLIDGSGRELDMGSPVDGAGPLARHGCTAIAPAAQRNRAILLGLMAAAGWDHYLNEWWHYQLYEPRRYPLLDESAAGTAMM